MEYPARSLLRMRFKGQLRLMRSFGHAGKTLRIREHVGRLRNQEPFGLVRHQLRHAHHGSDDGSGLLTLAPFSVWVKRYIVGFYNCPCVQLHGDGSGEVKKGEQEASWRYLDVPLTTPKAGNNIISEVIRFSRFTVSGHLDQGSNVITLCDTLLSVAQIWRFSLMPDGAV